MIARTSNPFKKQASKKPFNYEPGKVRAVAAAEWEELEERLRVLKTKQTEVELPGTWTVEDYREFTLLLAAKIERDAEAIYHYKPLPVGDQFHRCMAHEVGLSGSNRAGKTNAASAEVAMAAQHLHYVREKYPTDTGLEIACVGSDQKHLTLMYQYLCEKAPFNVFMHPLTWEWTVVIPDNPEHIAYKHLWQADTPMIAPRMIKDVAWESQKESIPNKVMLHNGTNIWFYSGLVRNLPRGRRFHLVWIDEEIEQPYRWIYELRARIADWNGRIFWSATPHRATEEFDNFAARARHPQNHTKPLAHQTAFFIMLAADNFYTGGEGKAALYEKIKHNDEEVQTRWHGLSARNLWIVYPEYGDHNRNIIHEYKPWYEDSKYIIIDPGRKIAAVLFVACPMLASPTQVPLLTEEEKWYRTRPGCMVCYDELYIPRANPDMVASAIKSKLNEYPASWIQEIIIDQRGGRSVVWRGMGENDSAESLYLKAIERYDIKAREPGFRYGSSDIDFGVRSVQEGLVQDFDHLPHIFVVKPKCETLDWEFTYWKKKRDKNDNVIGYEDKDNHLLSCLRYARTRGVTWVPPPAPVDARAWTYEDMKKAIDKSRAKP